MDHVVIPNLVEKQSAGHAQKTQMQQQGRFETKVGT